MEDGSGGLAAVVEMDGSGGLATVGEMEGGSGGPAAVVEMDGSGGLATVGEMEDGSGGPATVGEMEDGSGGLAAVVDIEDGSGGPATVGEMEDGSGGPATVGEMEDGNGGPAPPPYYLYAVAESNSVQTVSERPCTAVQAGEILDSPPPYYMFATTRATPVHSRPATVQNGTTTAQNRANRQSHTANPSRCHPCGFVLVLIILLVSLVNPFAFCCAVAGIVYIFAHNQRVCFLYDCLH